MAHRAFLWGGSLRKSAWEPDECYAIGGKKERPDLAIEVIWTSGGLDKLDVYRGLGIGELWLWSDNVISVYVLRNDGYERISESEVVPGIDLALAAELIARGESQSSTLRSSRLCESVDSRARRNPPGSMCRIFQSI